LSQTSTSSKRPPELWAGIECTQNRVGNTYFEQLDRQGHAERLADLDLLAGIGAVAARYPVLWERTAPESLESAKWDWADQRLNRLRELKVRPVVGLVHHGSGPRHTSLIDRDFPEKLAGYAQAVAARYPWVQDYTPINEPLTTARFAGLYGHWYPHGRDDETFIRCLLAECRGTVLAMRAIREVLPGARLIQTEDLGFTSSSPKLRYQAELENERRWLGFDLLCGRVDERHPLWNHLVQDARASADELLWFRENSCPPQVLGLNYYLSSERFLHEKLFLYPRKLHGGNGRDRYVDVETARVRTDGLRGAAELLVRAWHRYGIPLAITECHNGCTREEQLRWIQEVWTGCESAKMQGADIRAFTIWSLFGSFDWDSLVTQRRDHYEPGAFDIRSPQPRATAIAHAANSLARGEPEFHPLLKAPGWWRRPERLLYGFSVLDSGVVIPASKPQPVLHSKASPALPTLLVTGARGTLGKAFARICEVRGIPYHLLGREQMDIADAESVREAIETLQPWAVVNAAGYVRVDCAESEPERCFRENAEGAATLANACRTRGIKLLTFSSDLVFDGQKESAYVESDSVAPLNIYGASKVLAEKKVLEILPSALVIRTSAFFGPWDEYNFVTQALRKLTDRENFAAFADYSISPTYVPDLVSNCLDLLIDSERGIWHLANTGSTTWFEFAELAARAAGVSSDTLFPRSVAESAVPLPRHSALGSSRGWVMPSLESALRRYVADCELYTRSNTGTVAA
jgi:dTDP-4-dehydrorhamnose reductase